VQLDADRGVVREGCCAEEFVERDGAAAGREVEVAHAVGKALGDAPFAGLGLGAAKIVVEVDVAYEGGDGGALFEKIEAEGGGGHGGVAHVEAGADGGVVDGRYLGSQLGGPDSISIDFAAEHRRLGVGVLDGEGYAELRGEASYSTQRLPLGGEHLPEVVAGVARLPAAGVADHHARAQLARETDARLQNAALQARVFPVREVQGVWSVHRVAAVGGPAARLSQQRDDGPRTLLVEASADDRAEPVRGDLHEIRARLPKIPQLPRKRLFPGEVPAGEVYSHSSKSHISLLF
jgi:hypothetical protein